MNKKTMIGAGILGFAIAGHTASPAWNGVTLGTDDNYSSTSITKITSNNLVTKPPQRRYYPPA